MSKYHIKYQSTQRLHRSPRGRCQAIRNNCRQGAIPPDAWNDINLNRHNYMPQKVAGYIKAHGYPMYEAINKLQDKFNLSYKEAYYLCNWAYINRHMYVNGVLVSKYESVVPQGTLFIWKKKHIKKNKYPQG